MKKAIWMVVLVMFGLLSGCSEDRKVLNEAEKKMHMWNIKFSAEDIDGNGVKDLMAEAPYPDAGVGTLQLNFVLLVVNFMVPSGLSYDKIFLTVDIDGEDKIYYADYRMPMRCFEEYEHSPFYHFQNCALGMWKVTKDPTNLANRRF